MKIVQIVGHIASLARQFVGQDREVTVDMSNRDLLLHDGVTPGGRRFLNQNNADERYQAKNPELDGFAGFEPQQRGFWARLGPGDYRLRSLTVNELNLTLTNSNGYAGNPHIQLAAEIGTSHTWTGQHSFEDVVEFLAGINADVSGSLQGDVLGNVIGNLTGNAAGNHTGSFTGDVDVRSKTLQLDDGQIPLSKLNGLLAYVRLQAFPQGAIVMWSGDDTDIPAGWALCDGLNGTPDLRDRFIISVGVDVDAHDTGGSASHAHTSSTAAAGVHNHAITVAGHALAESEIPAHKHGNGVTNAATTTFNHGHLTASPTTTTSIDNNSDDGINEGYTTTVGSGAAHTHTASGDDAGSHTHDITVNSSFNVPPFYALCFIMRVAD